MNIGIFTDSYYPQISGVVTSTIILKEELEKLGHNVTIITVYHPDADIDEPDVMRLPSIPFLPLPAQRIGTIYSRKIMNRIKKLKLDVIHTQTEFSIGLFGRIAAKRLNIPVIHTYHTMYEDYVHYISKGVMMKPASKFAKKASKIYCKDCSAVIVPTVKVKEVLIDYGLRNHIEVIPTGINLEPLDKRNFDKQMIDILKNSLGISKNETVVLFVGRIAKEKSIDVIINSMPKLLEKIKDTKLLVVGDGPERENLEALAKNIGVEKSVIFAGEKPRKEIGKYYQLGDVFVSASITETQGLTFAEAMAAEIPVVAKYDKNLDGIIKNDVNGRIFNKDYELSDILVDILTNKTKALQLVKRAYEDMELLSSKHFGRTVEKVYFDVVHSECMVQYS